MADFPMTVSLLVSTYSFWSVLPFSTTRVGTFMRAPANCHGRIHAVCGRAHGSGLLGHLAAFLGVQHHGLVDARRGSFAASVPGQRGIAAGVDLDLVLADVDVVAVVQGGALDAEVVHESAV